MPLKILKENEVCCKICHKQITIANYLVNPICFECAKKQHLQEINKK